jgi:hypothetical protein
MGGAGGINPAVVTVGGIEYGPYGAGGIGGDSTNLLTGGPGHNGAVILSWGNGYNA